MTRARSTHPLKVAADLCNYEDAAILPSETDPQIYLSRNWLPQPFHLISATDTVLSQLSGSARVHLRDSSVNWFRLELGDHIYIPAGTPHRIEPIEEGVTLRYLSLRAGRQGAAWYCPECGTEVHRYEWEHDNDEPAVRFYAAACARFTADVAARTCDKCGALHPEIDLNAYGWATSR